MERRGIPCFCQQKLAPKCESFSDPTLSSRNYRAPSAGVKIGGSTTAAGAWRRYNLPVELGELNPRPKIFKNWPRAITLLSVRTALSNRFENKVMAGAAESCRSPSKPTATEAPALV
jgi:hypothetical protein